ncbi:DUF7130 family rubredoxin-like protein [Halalkalirubrum salinum]|uniref:DUF7130 family rubredoxin-like protein n=1 Tax=Halalkalirubrum salinum TaxID=2563889 RepID=UPI0010FAFB31|nr:hypothetical protein [Halalkalirubrum salinum]
MNPTTRGGDADAQHVEIGDAIYDADGTKLGVIRGFDGSGFYVTAPTATGELALDRSTAGGAGEAYLMWRCWECGEMGQIDELPESCPSCGAGKEELYYWAED